MVKNLFTALGRLFLIVVGLVAVFSFVSSNDKTTTSDRSALDAMPPSGPVSGVKANLSVPGWSYSQRTDNMRGVVTKFASLDSANSHAFEFPYAGGSKLNVTLRRTGDKDEVLLKVSKGQFVSCISSCTISAKFDDGKVLTYTGSAAADGRHDLIFINEVAGFVRRIGQAKMLILEPEFFKEGRRQFTFTVDGLKWP